MGKNNFMTYEEAKEFLKDKDIKTQREYYSWTKGKTVEYRLPGNPRSFYIDKWVDWSTFLSSDNISPDLRSKDFVSYEECMLLMRKNNIKTITEYNKFRENNKDILPASPLGHYKKECKNSYELFGREERVELLSFIDARKYVRKLNIKSHKEWQEYLKNKAPFIPSYPHATYKEWTSYKDFFGIEDTYTVEESNEYLSFDKAVDYMKSFDIRSSGKWQRWLKNKPEFIPKHPDVIYKDEWLGWDYFLGIKKINFLKYEEAVEYLKDLNIGTTGMYQKFILDNNIDFLPKAPHKYYIEFINYEIFFSCFNYSKFLKYSEAKEYLSKLKIQTMEEYLIWMRKNNIDFLPYCPSNVYEEWCGCNDYLSSQRDRTTGESLVEKYLIENNIQYIYQKKFEDCRNILELPFDFYLTEKNICIEFDGIQHSQSVEYYGGEEAFASRIVRDNIKTKYCIDNNIKLIRIPHLDLKNIDTILKNNL